SVCTTRRNQLIFLRRYPKNFCCLRYTIEDRSRTELSIDLVAPHIDLAAEGKAAVNLGSLSSSRSLYAVFEHLRWDGYRSACSKPADRTDLRDDGFHARVL